MMQTGFSWRRVWAVQLRHLFVLRSSWPRILELAYWPMVQMLMWGFITTFFMQHSSWVAQAGSVLISAVLLWDVLFRANLGVSLTFMEEMYARNLAQLFISPLKPSELVVAMTLLSLIRTLISVFPAALLALPFFDVWVFSLGLPLITFFANLMILGWVVGLVVSALVLRYGLGAQSLAWVAIFAFAPLSGIYYPIASLPDWLQPVAYLLPSAHVFEGMRAVLFDHVFRWDMLARAVGLNALYLAAAAWLFFHTLRVARVKGLLLQQGE